MDGNCPDVVALELNEGISRLRKHGLVIGEIQVTQAPKTELKNNLRIVKQQISLNGRVDLVVVYEQSSLLGKEV